jgi:uncharacterized protein (DUF4415 family)
MKIVWDEIKRQTNLAEHGMDFVRRRGEGRRRLPSDGTGKRFRDFDAPRQPEGKEPFMTSEPIHPLSDEDKARIQAGIASDPDNPELTDKQIAAAKPIAEVFPALSEAIKRARGRPKLDAPREAVTLRVSPETIARYKAIGGKEWRATMTEMLEKKAGG